MFEADAKATRQLEVCNILISYVNRRLTPDTIDEITDKILKGIESGPCSWAFKTAGTEKKDGP